jgi:hypothetical protein
MQRWLLTGRPPPAGAVLTGLVLLGTSVPAGAQCLTWTVVPSPNRAGSNAPQGVSCASATACTTVGAYVSSDGRTARTLIESWNGTRCLAPIRAAPR